MLNDFFANIFKTQEERDADTRKRIWEKAEALINQDWNAREPINFSQEGPIQPPHTDPINPVQQVQLHSFLKYLGINPTALAQENEARARTREHELRNQTLGQVLPSLAPEQQANIANKLDVSPVRASSGVVYNRFDTQNPVLAESSAVSGLGDKYNEETRGLGIRNDAIDRALSLVENDPMLSSAIANKTRVNTTTIKARVNGKDVLVSPVIENGRIRYQPAQTTDGLALEAPAAARPATRLNKSDATLWQEAVKEARAQLGRNPRYKVRGVPHEEVVSLAQQIFGDKKATPEDVDIPETDAMIPEPASPTVSSKPEETRMLRGKTYVKINGQWYEQ